MDAAQLDAPVSADPDDEQFLAAAQAGDAAWIVSGLLLTKWPAYCEEERGRLAASQQNHDR